MGEACDGGRAKSLRGPVAAFGVISHETTPECTKVQHGEQASRNMWYFDTSGDSERPVSVDDMLRAHEECKVTDTIGANPGKRFGWTHVTQTANERWQA